MEVKINPNIKKDVITRLKIAGTLVTFMVTGFFAARQVKLCKKAINLENKINASLSEIDYSDRENIPNVAAHRGFCSLDVEGTEKAIANAASKQYISTIEIDIRMTKDGQFVVYHDDNIYVLDGLDCFSGYDISEMSISSSTYSELQDAQLIYTNTIKTNVGEDKVDYSLIHYRILKLRNKIYKLVNLRDAIQACGDKDIILDLKIEDDDWQQYVNRLVPLLDAICEENGIDKSRITLSSFNVAAARYLRDNTDYTTAVIINEEENLVYCDEFDAVAIKYTLITGDPTATDGKEVDNEAARCFLDGLTKNKKVIIWTVNTAGTLGKFINTVGDSWRDVIYVSNNPDIIVWRGLKEKTKEDESDKTASTSNNTGNNKKFIITGIIPSNINNK